MLLVLKNIKYKNKFKLIHFTNIKFHIISQTFSWQKCSTVYKHNKYQILVIINETQLNMVLKSPIP